MENLEKIVADALRQTIAAHGPITKEWTGSAAKRITAMIRGAAKLERDYLLTTTPRKAKP